MKKNKACRRTVIDAVDGDTFITKRKVNGSNYIRVQGLDTPEKKEKGYSKAKNALNRLVKNKTVTLTPVGRSYGRTVAKVSVNRQNVAKEMTRYSK